MNNVMLDLETLGVTHNSVIVSIGAVRFDNSGIGDKFYAIVDTEDCVEHGLVMTPSTVSWWMGQSEEARSVFKGKRLKLAEALSKFELFLGAGKSDIKVWGNGAAFDNVILGNAYKAVRYQQPWKYSNDRCYRTVKSFYPEVKIEREGVYHNSLDDAIFQAKHLIEINKLSNVDMLG